MAAILVVDDEPEIYNIIERYARRDGYSTAYAENGTEAVALCGSNNFDLIIMDIMMPDMDGYEAVKEIKKQRDIPVLMLSALGSEYDKLYGFDLGIDDYMVKPFSPRELMARAHVIIKRHRDAHTDMKYAFGEESPAENTPEIIRAGSLTIDIPGHSVYIGPDRIELTVKEFDLLCYMVQNRNIALSRSRILDAVWGYEYNGEDRTVDWQIKLLRSKLGCCRNYVKTIRGIGYKFEITE